MLKNNRETKGADYAREAIAFIAKGQPRLKARIRVAEHVLQIGNYTEEGLAEWRAYLAMGCPSATDI